MGRMLVLAMGLGAVAPAATARPRAFYETTHLQAPALEETYRAGLVREVQGLLEAQEVRAVEVRGRDGGATAQLSGRPSPAELAAQPLPVLLALKSVLEVSRVGVEWDLVARLASGQALLLTAWFEPDRTLIIAQGGPLPAIAPAPVSTEDLRALHHTGPLRDAGARWTGAERARVAAALSRLSEGERALVDGLAWWRMPAAPEAGTDRGHAGHYRMDEQGPRIQVYDRLFEDDQTDFVGSLEAPVAPSEHGLLHELGHALAHAPTRTHQATHLAAVETYNAAARAVNARAEAANALTVRLNAAEPEQRSTLEQQQQAAVAAYEAARGAVDVASAAVERSLGPLRGSGAQSAVVAAYAALPEALSGPTPYGSMHPDESFAEAFALFHADPAALLRVNPAVHAWFAAGRHVAVALASRDGG